MLSNSTKVFGVLLQRSLNTIESGMGRLEHWSLVLEFFKELHAISGHDENIEAKTAGELEVLVTSVIGFWMNPTDALIARFEWKSKVFYCAARQL
jgi:hypothetical protein